VRECLLVLLLWWMLMDWWIDWLITTNCKELLLLLFFFKSEKCHNFWKDNTFLQKIIPYNFSFNSGLVLWRECSVEQIVTHIISDVPNKYSKIICTHNHTQPQTQTYNNSYFLSSSKLLSLSIIIIKKIELFVIYQKKMKRERMCVCGRQTFRPFSKSGVFPHLSRSRSQKSNKTE
jgi:hypothetical protein